MIFGDKTVFEGTSDFGRYRVVDTVYDGRRARVLYGDDRSPQSGTATDDDPTLLFDYNQRFLEIVESVRPRRVLIIGGGVFMLPKAILARFDDIKIDVVEIDPLLPQLARDYFGLTDDPRIRIIVDDGRHYIESTTDMYDMIIVDAFSGYTIPQRLISTEATGFYDRILAPDGLLAINFISRYQTYRLALTHQLVATFGQVFRAQSIYPADHRYPERDEQNLILVTGRHTPRLDYVQSIEVSLPSMPDRALLYDQ